MESIHVVTINGGTALSGVINGLDKYTEYEFSECEWLLHLMVMDLRVLWWWKEQWKMVRNLIA